VGASLIPALPGGRGPRAASRRVFGGVVRVPGSTDWPRKGGFYPVLLRMVIGVECGKESGEVLHLHAAVDHHIATERRAQHSL
jgi:hypothetical protein